MPKSKLRVLIADSHYLIAMDLERILTETGQCDINLCPVTDLEQNLRQGSYDIVMLDAVASPTLNLRNVETVAATKAQVVFLTTIDDFHDAYPALKDYTALQKPFDPDVVEAVIARVGLEKEAARLR